MFTSYYWQMIQSHLTYDMLTTWVASIVADFIAIIMWLSLAVIAIKQISHIVGAAHGEKTHLAVHVGENNSLVFMEQGINKRDVIKRHIIHFVALAISLVATAVIYLYVDNPYVSAFTNFTALSSMLLYTIHKGLVRMHGEEQHAATYCTQMLLWVIFIFLWIGTTFVDSRYLLLPALILITFLIGSAIECIKCD